MAFREIGRGQEAMLTFTLIMNMPPPLSKSSFYCIDSKLYDAYKSVAEQSMRNADSSMNDIIVVFLLIVTGNREDFPF